MVKRIEELLLIIVPAAVILMVLYVSYSMGGMDKSLELRKKMYTNPEWTAAVIEEEEAKAKMEELKSKRYELRD